MVECVIKQVVVVPEDCGIAEALPVLKEYGRVNKLDNSKLIVTHDMDREKNTFVGVWCG